MNGYVLDTNIVSELFKAKPDERVAQFYKEAKMTLLSVAVFAELAYGVDSDKDMQRKERLISFISDLRLLYKNNIIPITLEVAETAGRLRAFAKSQGRILHPMDSFMAATAMNNGAILATRNAKDFYGLDVPLINPFDRAYA